MSLDGFVARSAAVQRDLAREHPLVAFAREWWDSAGTFALCLLLTERFFFPEDALGVRLGFTVTLAMGALVAGARVIGLRWAERRRVARGDP